jgi:hypothetical protein
MPTEPAAEEGRVLSCSEPNRAAFKGGQERMEPHGASYKSVCQLCGLKQAVPRRDDFLLPPVRPAASL